MVRRVLFISEESIAGGATPKYTTRPRVLRGTRKGSFMETGGERGREEVGNKGKAEERNIMDSNRRKNWEGKKHKLRKSRREGVNSEAKGLSVKFDWKKNMKDGVIDEKDV